MITTHELAEQTESLSQSINDGYYDNHNIKVFWWPVIKLLLDELDGIRVAIQNNAKNNTVR